MRAYVFQKRFFCIAFFLAIFSVQPVFADEVQWVEVIGEASMANITKEKARQDALHDARAKALKKAAEFYIESLITEFQAKADSLQASGSYREYFDLFPNFIRSVSFGWVIIEENILDEGIKRSDRPKSEIYRVTLKAKVALEQGKQDSDFNIDVKLNKDWFTDGDRLVVTIKSTEDCYITIFNIQPDGTMTLLLPDPVIGDNFLPAGEWYQFPPEGMDYQTALLPGDQSTTEMLLVIATRDPINFPASQATSIDNDTSAPMLSATLLDLHQWLVDIPIHQRTVSSAIFDIVASASRGEIIWFDKVRKRVADWINSSKCVAVVIGIDEYQHKEIRDLRYAVKDAKAVKELLQQKTRFEIYKEELYNEQATKDNILDVIDNLSNDRSIDRIIFYFSGHGRTQKAETGDQDLGFFLPVDSDPDKLFKTAIPMDQIRTWAQSLPARHVLFIFDACFSGIVGGSARSNRDYNLDFLAEHIGRHVITAGTKNDEAIEYNKLEHGVLTYYLLQGIEKGEADIQPRDGMITLNELELYLQDRVTNFTEGKQHPQLIKFFDGDGELFIEIAK